MKQLQFQNEVFKELEDSETLEELEWKVSEMKKVIEFAEKKNIERLKRKDK